MTRNILLAELVPRESGVRKYARCNLSPFWSLSLAMCAAQLHHWRRCPASTEWFARYKNYREGRSARSTGGTPQPLTFFSSGVAWARIIMMPSNTALAKPACSLSSARIHPRLAQYVTRPNLSNGAVSLWYTIDGHRAIDVIPERYGVRHHHFSNVTNYIGFK